MKKPEWLNGRTSELVVCDLLTPLFPCNALFLELPLFRRGELFGLLVVDLVAHGVVCVLFLTSTLVDASARALALNPVVARRFEAAVTHRPHFLAQRLGEVTVMGDDEDTTFEHLQCLNKGSERLTIEVVGGLVEAHDVGTTPCCGTEDNLDFLTTRETPHGVVGDELRLETEVSEMLLNLPTNEGTEETEALSLAGIDLNDFLLNKRSVSKMPTLNDMMNGPSRNHA